jgi:adenylate kinase
VRDKGKGPSQLGQTSAGHNVSRVLLTGVPGAGKSSLASGISRSIAGVVTCEFGQIMAKIGRQQGLLSTHRDLSSLPLPLRARLQVAAAEDISRMSQPAAIAAHVVVQAPEGYVEGLPDQALSYLMLTGIIVISSDPHDIRDRCVIRGSDYGDKGVELIDIHQELVRRRASVIAQAHNIPIGYIVNTADELPNAILDAVQLWKSFDRGLP